MSCDHRSYYDPGPCAECDRAAGLFPEQSRQMGDFSKQSWLSSNKPMSESFTVEKLRGVIAQLPMVPGIAIVVSKYVDPEGSYKIPPAEGESITTHIIGGEAWKKLAREAAHSNEPTFSGVPVRFSPRDWRP